MRHLLIACALAAALPAAAKDKPKDPVTVKVIGFNDYHGNLQSPAASARTRASRPRSARRSAAPMCWPRTSRA